MCARGPCSRPARLLRRLTASKPSSSGRFTRRSCCSAFLSGSQMDRWRRLAARFRQAELTAGRLSVPIRRSPREELAEWTRLINDTGDRGPSKNPAAVGENSRKSIAD